MSRKEIQLRDILQALHWILQNISHCFLESYAKRPQPALITLYPVYYRITPILKNFSTNLEPKVGPMSAIINLGSKNSCVENLILAGGLRLKPLTSSTSIVNLISPDFA